MTGFLGECHKSPMAESLKIKNPSLLVESVLTLDHQLSELENLSKQIEKMDMHSEFDLERVQKMMNKFTTCGQNVSDEVTNLSVHLNEARVRAEAAAQVVADCAQQLQERKNQIQKKLEDFSALGEKVRALTLNLSDSKTSENPTEAEKAELSMRISEFEIQLQPLIEEANQIKKEAQESKIRVLERQADALSQKLVAASQKLNTVTRPTQLQ